MPVTNVKSRWSSGSLIFHEDGNLGDAANLLSIATSGITIGNASNDVDFTIYLGAADQYVKFDSGLASVTFAKVDVGLSGDLTITVEDISVAQGRYIYLDGQDGSEYIYSGAAGKITIAASGVGADDITLSGTVTISDDLTLSAGAPLICDDTTDASSATTGSIQTDGGLGVAKKVYVGTDLVMVGGDIDLSTAGTGTYDLVLKDAVADALSIKRGATDVIVFDTTTPKVTITPATDIVGILSVTDATDASAVGTASVTTAGGLGVTKKAYIGTDLVMVGGDIDMTTAGTGTYELKLKDAVADALSIVRGATDVIVFDTTTPKVTITPAVDITGILSIDDATDASATTTASLQTDGGLGVAKKAYIGTDLVMVGGDIDMTTAGTGTYDLLLKDAVANALSIKRGATDMIVFDSSTPSINITPAVTMASTLSISPGAAITNGIDFTACANITNLIKFNAVAGPIVANALVPAAAPDGTTMGADAAITVLINATPYYIPLYDTLHA